MHCFWLLSVFSAHIKEIKERRTKEEIWHCQSNHGIWKTLDIYA